MNSDQGSVEGSISSAILQVVDDAAANLEEVLAEEAGDRRDAAANNSDAESENLPSDEEDLEDPNEDESQASRLSPRVETVDSSDEEDALMDKTCSSSSSS